MWRAPFCRNSYRMDAVVCRISRYDSWRMKHINYIDFNPRQVRQWEPGEALSELVRIVEEKGRIASETKNIQKDGNNKTLPDSLQIRKVS